jgi:glycosyltransferase involved in cell wall biosynthesis
MEDMQSRALYVAFDVFPKPKGSSSHIASMIIALARDFAPVCVLCLGDAELPAYQIDGAIEIHRLPGTHRDVLHRATAFAQFVEFHAARHAPSLELIIFRDPWGGIPAMRGARHSPAIFEVNALPTWEVAYSRPGFAESATLPAKLGDMERACLREAAAVLCVSAVTRRALEAEGVPAAKLAVVPNAANKLFFQAATQPCTIPVLAEGEWCGYIGGLQTWQGVEFLIDAFALTTAGRLLIVHSGNRGTREIERRIARHSLGTRVLLQGPLAPHELAEVFARLRFTVAPLAETARNTWQGCCPVKIVESMAAAVPVIASDLAVSRELIDDGKNGLLAAPGDRRAWALAMEKMFLDASLRDTLAANAFSTASDYFSQPVAHEQLSAIFRTVAAARAIGVSG